MQTGNTLHYTGLIVKTQKIVVSAKICVQMFFDIIIWLCLN